jgi:xylan 1,4-beta-xylosidase
VQPVSNRPFYTKLVPAAVAAPAHLTFKSVAPGKYRVRLKRTGFRANDAYSAYIEMGSPASLDAAQLAKLQELTRDLPQLDQTVVVGAKREYALKVPMHANDIVLVTLEPIAN